MRVSTCEAVMRAFRTARFEKTHRLLWRNRVWGLGRRPRYFGETECGVWGDALLTLKRQKVCFGETPRVLWGDAEAGWLGRQRVGWGDAAGWLGRRSGLVGETQTPIRGINYAIFSTPYYYCLLCVYLYIYTHTQRCANRRIG